VPEYWLDANVFIESKNRYYAFDLVPGFWRLLEQKCVEGVIASSTLVYDELEKGADDLAEWAKNQKALFVEPDQAVQSRFTDIANYVNSRYPATQARQFLAGADPWLIAHAKTYGDVVVTREDRVPSHSSKAKIPNVCDYFGIGSIDLFEMLRRLRAQFG